jgi:hypothetical protein
VVFDASIFTSLHGVTRKKITTIIHIAVKNPRYHNKRNVSVSRFIHLAVFLTIVQVFFESRDSSVGIALGYRLDDRGSRIRFLAVSGNFSLHHHFQNGSGAHPASYPMSTRASFPGDKAAGA